MTTSRMRGLIACATAACALLIALPGAAQAASATWSSTGPVQVSSAGPFTIKVGNNTYGCPGLGPGTTWGTSSQVKNANEPAGAGGTSWWGGLDYQSFECTRQTGHLALVHFTPKPYQMWALKNGSVFSLSGTNQMNVSGTAFITAWMSPPASYTASWTNGTSAAAPSKATFVNAPVGTTTANGQTISLTGTFILRTATGGLLTLS